MRSLFEQEMAGYGVAVRALNDVPGEGVGSFAGNAALDMAAQVQRILSLLRNPEAAAYVTAERERLRDPQGQIAELYRQKEKLARKRDTNVEMRAEGDISKDVFKQKLAALDEQEAAIDERLEPLRDSERYLAELEDLAGSFVRDLPYLLDIVAEREPENKAAAERGVYEDMHLSIVAHK
jgi:hypothetical protein